ncbi:MAG TPA: hypothetical protein VFJ82_25305 [Longimicrobium sp.]|nr:hypothetical protein [Longimicrobium sp.]
MRSTIPVLAALVLLPAAAALTACSDATGVENFLRGDSIDLAAVNGPSKRATAVDILNGVILSFPERPAYAGAYDFQVRQHGSTLWFVPNRGESGLRGTGLLETTRTYEKPGSAPRPVDEYERDSIAVAAGKNYFVQTRVVPSTCSTTSKYALINILAVNADSGKVTFRMVSNQNCDDERLEP